MDAVDELIERLRFHGRYAAESNDQLRERKHAEREEAATALREQQEEAAKWKTTSMTWAFDEAEAKNERDEAITRAEAAEARVKELEADVGVLKLEREEEDNGKEDLGRLLGLTEEFRWKRMRYAINELVRERDEALKALEPFAKAADGVGMVYGDDFKLDRREVVHAAMLVTIGDLRRARDVREKLNAKSTT